MDNVEVTVEKAMTKDKKREYEYVQVTIGDWEGRIYPRTKFELNYIKQQLGE